MEKNIKHIENKYTMLVEQLKKYDLEPHRESYWNRYGNETDTEFYVRTLSDESVGIFPCQVSPSFTNADDLCNWWQRAKEIFGLK